jgi:hypothetical protein
MPDSEFTRGFRNPETLAKAQATMVANREAKAPGNPGRPARAPTVAIHVTAEQAFIAQQMARRAEITQGPVADETETSGGIVTHSRPGTVTMYKPDGKGGFTPRVVPVTAIQQNLAVGFTIYCPQCYDGTPGSGQHGGKPNDCPGRPPLASRICPVCRKQIYDNLGDVDTAEVNHDPNVIVDDAYSLSTPATRTKAMLDQHIRVRHEITAEVMGLARPAPTAINPQQTALTGAQ